jgi:hypothetical protein
MKLAGPFTTDLLYLVASTRRAFGNREHDSSLSEGLLG